MSLGTHAARTGSWTFRPRRERATFTTWRGHLWAVVIGLDFYFLSNPLVYEPVFAVSLQRAVLVTALAVVVSLPWLRVPQVSLSVTAFLVWGLVSAFWSIQPGATVATVGLYVTLAALAVATYANASGQVLALGFVYGGVLVTALSLYSFNKRLAGAYYEALEGTVLAGVGTNQNILAYTATLAMAGWLALWPKRPVVICLWMAAGATLLYAVYVAGSAAGYLTTAAMIATTAALWVVSRPRGREWTLRRRRTWTLVLGVVVLAAAATVGFSGHGPGTFSDRLPFWEATMSVAKDRPLVGYGWGAVWAHPWLSAPPNAVVDSIYAAAGSFLTHGHNSFVDLVIDVGTVGVTLMLVIIASVVRTAARLPVPTLLATDTVCAELMGDAVRSRFALLCVVDLLVFGITEPLLVIPIGFWALILLAEPRTVRQAGAK